VSYDQPRRERGKERDGGAIVGHGELQTRDLKHKNLKEEHWEGEEKMANSPKRIKRAQIHP
jgi:hypothetical protein